MMKHVILALCFIHVSDPDLRSKIDPLAEELLKQQDRIGFVVGIRVHGENHIFGYGTVETLSGRNSPNADTIFEIGSITKGFTGVLLAESIRRGEVMLDRPAQDYLPPDLLLPRTGDTPISLRQLATHRSGLPSIPITLLLLAKDTENPYADFDRAKLSKALTYLKPAAPGEQEIYSNLGAGLVGTALVHATKSHSYNDLVRQRICEPLGMSDTTEALTGEQKTRLATGHNRQGKRAKHWDFASLEGAGALHSTARDMLTFAAASLGEVTADISASILESQKVVYEKSEMESIGLFWRITRKKTATMIWHNGGTGGFRSMLAIMPKTRTAVVLLCAASQDQVDAIAIRMLEAIHPDH